MIIINQCTYKQSHFHVVVMLPTILNWSSEGIKLYEK